MKDLNLPVIIAILASGALTLYPFAMFFCPVRQKDKEKN